jgi:hypothetical protein
LNRRPLRPEANARGGVPPPLPCLTCLAPSVDVRWRPLVSVAVVTHLVTHPPGGAVVVGRVASFSGNGSRASRRASPAGLADPVPPLRAADIGLYQALGGEFCTFLQRAAMLAGTIDPPCALVRAALCGSLLIRSYRRSPARPIEIQRGPHVGGSRRQ